MGLHKPHEKREKTAVAFRGAGYVTLRVASRMRCAWLYDETINAYMWLLQERDKALCLADPSRKPTYFFSSFFFEKMFEGRMYFVDPLIQMGANAIICDPHRVIISGRSPLRGQTVRSPDIRAGMAMIIAALCATHRPCVVQNAEIVDRGYERVEEKLRALGADIVREAD